MKGSKVVLSILLVVVLCFSWVSFFTSTIGQQNEYNECIKMAEESFEEGLYEQAVEFYKESLTYKSSQEIYEKIMGAYEALYEEEHTAYIRSIYIEDMALAAKAYPKYATFWTKQIELQMESTSYAKAYKTAKQALQYGAKSDKLDELYTTLLYMVKEEYDFFTDFKTALNGYISIFDGANWRVVDETGEDITRYYRLAGLINDDGKGIYVNEIDTRLLDANEITRARFDVDVQDAGYYNEKVDLLPVKINGVWKYMNTKGEFLPGEYEVAGSFYDNEAVAYSNGQWVKVDQDGQTSALKDFEEIKLDLYGCHNQNGILIGKSQGVYRLYDLSLERIGDFSAEDMDICIDSDRIAFKKDGKWGFVNSKGEIVQSPTYANAKSFANGYAAVCNEEGLWGFINTEHELVIDYQYLDAYYFTEAETCIVSISEGMFQMIRFMFD